MKTFVVTFDAQAEVEVEADNAWQARLQARQQLDPDVDWDHKSTEEKKCQDTQ